MFHNYVLWVMDKLTYELTILESDRVRIVVTMMGGEVELGTLYFEKAKRSFSRKPIGMDSWACVDAKIEGLYVHGGEEITPKDIVAHCQELIRASV
jgi:hemolysin-activating ACP:hemolysin acyltransferase